MTRLYDGNDYLEIQGMWSDDMPDYTADFLELGGLKYDHEHQAYLVQDVHYVADQITDWTQHVGDFRDDMEDVRDAEYDIIEGGQMWAKGLLEQSGYFRDSVKETFCCGRAYASQGVAYYIDEENCKWAVKPHEEEGWLWTAWKADGGTWTDWHEERAGA